MALTNCTITSQSFTKTGGSAIGSENAQLVITPDTGYVVSASNFTNNTGSLSGISSITLSDSGTAGTVGNTVLVAIDLDNTYVMPSADTTLTIDIDGAADLIQYSVAGSYSTVVTNATPASETNTSYSASGNYGVQTTLFTKTFTASSGYYFKNTPIYELTADSPSRYEITTTKTLDGSNRLTAITFTVKYTFSNDSDSGDFIKFTAEAELIFVPTVEIIAYSIIQSGIGIDGETRTMDVYGYPGAEFSLTVNNEDPTAIKTITNQAIPSSGVYSFDIVFPAVTDDDQYDFVLTGDLSSDFDTSNGQPSTFNIKQLLNIDVAIGLTHSDSDITTTANKSKTLIALSELNDTDGNFDNDFTISTTAYDKLIIDDSTVTLTEFTNTDSSSNGGTVIEIEGLTFTTINDTSIKASLDAYVTDTGNADVTSLLALASYISGNNIPTDISLSATSIAENNSVNAVIGALTTTDADSGDTHTYTLVSGTGSTDNASFNISGSNLRAGIQFDFETKNSYSIRIRTTDSKGDYFEKAFTISVTNVNEAPTDIALSSTSIDENNSVNDVIGAFSTTDVDSGDTHTYTLVSGTGSTDNSSFNISGSNLRAGVVFDYETKNSYSIRVRSTDAGGLYVEKAFTITIGNELETTNSFQVQKFTGSGSTSTYYYISATQACEFGSLALTACDYSTLTNKFIKIRETNCSGNSHIAKIIGASETTANAYHDGQNHYTSYSNANTNTSGTSCSPP